MPPPIECSSKAYAQSRRRLRTKLKRTTYIIAIFLLALALVVPVANALDTACRAELLKADKNGDERLDRVEFLEVVKSLSGGTLGGATTLDYLPRDLQETFDELSCQCDKANQDISCCPREHATIDLIRWTERIRSDDDICGEISTSIHRALEASSAVYPCPIMSPFSRRELQAVNVSFSECVMAMNVADSNKDNFLNQNEYMIFVNVLSNNTYEGQSISDVPAVIRRNFFQLAGDNGQIDISGSKLSDGQTDSQRANLHNVCTRTTDAINLASGTGCFIAMNSADANNDSQLNQAEYFTFVNILANNTFEGQSFADLPQEFKRNFFMWRSDTTNQINIFGSKPGEDADADQMAFLDMVCTETEILLNPTEAPATTPTIAPAAVPPTVAPSTASQTAVPTVAPTPVAPTVAPTTAPQAAVPTVTPTSVATTIAPAPVETTVAPTTAAPTVISTSAATTAPTNVPTVTPQVPPTISPTKAEPVPTEMTVAPTVTPPPPPGVFAGNATIESRFTISNTIGKTADDINFSQDFKDLKEAYTNLAMDVVAGLASRRRLRRRRLAVAFIDNSTEMSSASDLSRCPPEAPDGSACQTVSASYKVSFTDEDPDTVTKDYTAATEVAINMGALQEELVMISPNTDLTIISMPLPPSAAPTAAPDEERGLSAGAIAGIAVAGVTVVGGAVAALYFTQRKHVPPKKKPLKGDVEIDSVDSSFGGPSKVGSTRPSTQAKPSGTFAGSGAQVAAAATEPEYGDDDDYSFESGSFYDDIGSALQSPLSPAGTTASQIENYKFDEPQVKQHGGAAGVAGAGAVVAAAAVYKQTYESSSNAGSSGWSSSEDDTDSSEGSSSYSSANSDMEESNDSFFNNDKKTAENRADHFDEPAAVTSPQPQSEESGSYDDSTFSSDFTPQPATPPEKDQTVPVPVPVPMPRRSDDESSESYTSSDNSSYESSTIEGRESRGLASGDTSIPSAALHDSSTTGTGGKSSGETASKSLEGSDLQGSLNERATELESLVEKGDWEGVIASAQKFEADTEAANSPSTGSGKRIGTSCSSTSGSEYSSGGSSEGSSSSSGVSGSESSNLSRARELETSGKTGESYETSGSTEYTGTSTTSETPEEARRRAEYRAEVEALVRLVVPEEIDNVDVMMVQFRGREAELVSTLRNMQERSVAQRARAAVHKSRGQPPRRDPVPGQYRKDGNYSTDSRLSERTDDTYGSAAGSAAIAAASVPRPAAGGRVPIHPPPVPAHESTHLESLGSSTTPDRSLPQQSPSVSSETPSAQSTSGSFTSASRSYEDSRLRGSVSGSSSSSSSRSNDSPSGSKSGSSSSGSSSTASSYSSSGVSGSGSTSRSSYKDRSNDEYYTSQGTGTNYDTSQGTSFTESQGTVEEDDRFTQQRRPTQRRGSIKPWLTSDDDTHADLDESDLGLSVGGDFHSVSK